MKRVVVTGMGTINPLGHNVHDSWEKVKAGISGVDYATRYNRELLEVQIAAEVKNFDAEAYLDPETVRLSDPTEHFALVASQEALKDSQLPIDGENSYLMGCVVGTGIGNVISVSTSIDNFIKEGAKGISSVAVPNFFSDQISAKIAVKNHLHGPSHGVISACSSGNNAIGLAYDSIRMGRTLAMLAGAAESCIINTVMAGFSNIKALAHQDGSPTEAARPFDLNRTGFVIGEGSSFLVLEELEHAQARGAKIYAEVTGYGHTSDAYHVTAPREDGASASLAIQRALKEAKLNADEIDYISAHGTGTKLNDRSETIAVKLALGDSAYKIPMSSVKALTGHMMGASSAFEGIVSVQTIQEQFVPPTINYQTQDPECDLDYIPNIGRERKVQHVMNNSFGFGGHNAVIIFSKFES